MSARPDSSIPDLAGVPDPTARNQRPCAVCEGSPRLFCPICGRTELLDGGEDCEPRMFFLVRVNEPSLRYWNDSPDNAGLVDDAEKIAMTLGGVMVDDDYEDFNERGWVFTSISAAEEFKKAAKALTVEMHPSVSDVDECDEFGEPLEESQQGIGSPVGPEDGP